MHSLSLPIFSFNIPKSVISQKYSNSEKTDMADEPNFENMLMHDHFRVKNGPFGVTGLHNRWHTKNKNLQKITWVEIKAH